MASESSFDVVSKVDMAEVNNAVNQALMEIKQRFDFKGSKSSIEADGKENKITVVSDDNIKIKSVIDILQSKLIKRNVPIKNMVYGKVEPAAEGTARQVITIQQGIPTEKGKEIVKLVKESKLKVQASIQQEQVRISGKSKDDLQEVMQLLKGKDLGIQLQFINYR